MSPQQQPRPETVGPDDLKDAGALLLAVLGAAVPVSVAVGIGLLALRLHDADIDPLPVIARVPKEELALLGSQVLIYVAASTVFALCLVLLTDALNLMRRRSVRMILRTVGALLLLAAWPLQQHAHLWVLDFDVDGPIFEEPARWAAVFGGGFLLAASMIFRRTRWNDWRYSVGAGVTYTVLATAAVLAYLVAADSRSTTRSSLGPPVTVLLDNPRPEQKGKPRKRQEGRLVWSSTDGVGVCVRCERFSKYRRVVELPRRRIVWVRVQSRDTPPRTPRRRELKPFT